MRLICPNCGAQYEVGDDVIPTAGRDVQCSNCGHSWFQRPASQDRDLAEEMGLELPEDDDGAAEHLPEDELPEADTAEVASDHLPEDEFEEDYNDPDERDLKRQELDPDVVGILREEAEREQAERAEETGGLETQTELGLESGDDNAARAERAARLRGLSEDEADEDEAAISAVVATSARRDLLPDIEEINSTLTATSERQEDDDDDRDEKRARSGFRRGFIIAVLFFALLALVYSYAPRIVESFPGAEPALSSYVDAVNQLRLWVDMLMQKAVDKLTVLLGQVSNGG